MMFNVIGDFLYLFQSCLQHLKPPTKIHKLYHERLCTLRLRIVWIYVYFRGNMSLPKDKKEVHRNVKSKVWY